MASCRPLGWHLLLIFICTSSLLIGQSVHSDFNSSIDFSRYHTYQWLKVDLPNSIWNDRAERAIDAALATKGWSRTETNADAAIVALGTTQTKTELSTFYSGMSGWGWGGWGPGTATVVPIERREGTLIVDIYDTNTRQLIWRATSTETLSDEPHKNVKKLEKAVEKMFKKFPAQRVSTGL